MSDIFDTIFDSIFGTVFEYTVGVEPSVDSNYFLYTYIATTEAW